MAKYSTYIELSPNYESVVDIDSETRNPDMWQEYIVHEDMKDAIEKICDSLKFEDLDKRRSFWIHGAYGTGKSYAAIVLKHLFEDSIKNIRNFLSNQILIPYRDKFLSIREKGEFLVIWKSQATDIKSGTQLMMTMENAIREKLKEKYGDNAYYGKKSLISSAQEAVNDTLINWDTLFDDPTYGLFEDYASFDDFKTDVLNGNLKAANIVARIYREKGWGFFTTISTFKAWVADVIDGNNLQNTGIIFIWDEFTSYLRNNPTDDVLQPLSEFCKEQPFFMCLIVHKAPSWVSQIGEEVYEQIVHRYHSLDFHVSESAAYELIGNSIRTRAGMEQQWKAVQDDLMKSISKNYADFDNLDMNNKKERLRQLCPLHPMTLSLLAIVAQNFGASQRTLFRFMKDSKEAEQNVGFLHFINTYGPSDWCWLTSDFLWDYFFTRESDVRNFSTEAKSAYQHYMTKKEYISDEYHMHVFKAAMLLIAVMSSVSVSNLYSQATHRKVSATKSTLYKCFSGILTKDDVDSYLYDLDEIGVLRLDPMTSGDVRLQIPYSGNTDVFDVRKEMLMKKYTRHELFKKGGIYARSIEAQIWDKNKASYARLCIAACDSTTNSIKLRLGELQNDLIKNPYKFGILVVVVAEAGQYTAMQTKVKKIADEDTTGRLAVYLLKAPLTEEHLERWYNAMTHSELAGEEGKSGDAERYQEEAATIVEEWSQVAKDDQIMCVYRDRSYPSEYGTYSLAGKIEKEILFGLIFTAAPEKIVTTSTAYKKIQTNFVLAGIQKTNPNTQVGNIIAGLKTVGVWDTDGLEALSKGSGTPGAEAIAKLSEFILERFSQGTQIKLDVLWQELQEAPFGYFNSIVSGYILGFLLRYYVNSDFSWNKSDNNPWPLTEQNLASMITSMCKGDAVNNYLSPGSEVWQNFKPYVIKIFRLDDVQAVNETEARKYISKQCTEKVGVPFWVLKYVPESKFGGVNVKATADEIIDLFCDFMSETGDSEQIMSSITIKFKGNGPVRKALEQLYFDTNVVYEAFSTFIIKNRPELKGLYSELSLTNLEISDAIHQVMQGQVSNWTEAQVEEKLDAFCIEYRVVVALNEALNLKRKSIQKLSEDISNTFNNMKVPGNVIEKMGYPWVETLKALHDISERAWNMIALETRAVYADLLGKDVHKVWGEVTVPKSILKKYIEITKKNNCSDKELEDIYNALKPVKYDSTTEFETQIDNQLNKVAYNRNKLKIQELWEEQSGFESVESWCSNYAVPIQWVVSDAEVDYINVLKIIQDGKTVGITDLHNATRYFESNVIVVLKNKDAIKNSFFAQIGENYRPAFDVAASVIVARLKTNKRLSKDVYSWANKVGEIRNTVDAFLRDKYCETAKNNVKSMSEKILREKVIKLLEDNPDLYAHFIK